MSKKDKIAESNKKKSGDALEKALEEPKKKQVKQQGGDINDGKCCRCSSRKNKKCNNPKGKNHGKFCPRKDGCACFHRKG